MFTITDTRGNVYRRAVQRNETTDGTTLALYYAENIAAGANTVKVADSIAGGTLRVAIMEFAGVASSSSLDVSASAQGSGATPSSGSATTTVAGDLVIGVISTANSRTISAGSGYTVAESSPASPNTKLMVEYQRQSAAGAISATASLSSADTWSALMAAFRPGSVAPPPPTGDTQPPTAPANLTATASGSSQIALNWAPATDNTGVTAYRVEQCAGTGCSNFNEIATVNAAAAGGPLTASANPNYFKDASGTPIILNGSHTWNSLQDWGSNGTLQPLDFNAFVSFLVQHGHNFTMLWYTELPTFCGLPTTATSPPDFTVGPHPWQRTGPGTATDGKAKFDLTKLDQSYFDRLRARVQALNSAGIYAGVYLFSGEWMSRYRCATDGYPLTGTNNINGVDAGTGNGAITMSAPNAVTAVQDQYVEKLISTINDLPNVLWIVSQEAAPESGWWNAHQISHIRSFEGTLPHQHPIGYGTPSDLNDSVILNSNADWIAPGTRISATTSCGTGTPRCKVNVNDSDHTYFGLWNDTVQQNRNYAWENFMTGNQVAFMDPYVVFYPREARNNCGSPANAVCSSPDARYNNFRDNLGYILRYSRRVNLANVLPRSSLCSTSYCLAQTPSVGAEYLVYAPDGGSFTVNLSAMASSRRLNVEWFNPATGATTTAASVAAGSTSASFTPPFSGDAVLYLVDTAGHAGSTGSAPPSTSYTVTNLTPGSYTYRVRAVDAASNFGPYSNQATASLQTSDTQAPSTPTGLTATAPNPGEIRLNWTASTDNVGVTSYSIARCQGTGCSAMTTIGSSPAGATTFTDSGLAASTSYTYQVRAVDAANNQSPYSLPATATTMAQPTAAIALVQHAGKDAGTTTSSSLAFASSNTQGNWIGVAIRAGQTGQSFTVSDTRSNVYRKAIQLNETADGTSLALYYAENVAGGANTVTVADTLAGGTLRFAIFEYSGVAAASSLDGVAAAQGTSSTPASGPATTTGNGDLVIGLISTANSSSATASSGFTIEERVPAAPNTKLYVQDQLQASAGSVSATASLGASDNWGAAIAAFKAGGGGTTDTTPPSAPGTLSATAASGTRVDLSWGAATDNVGVTGYRVEQCVGSGCTNFVKLATVSTTSFSDTALTPNTTYRYVVRATDAAGNLGPYSNTATVTTLSTTPELVAAYSFNEGTGTTVGDASANGRTGTLANGSWTTAGKYGNAIVFNGTSTLVTVADAASLHLTTAMTLEAWVNPSVISSARREVIAKSGATYFLEATTTAASAPGGGGTFGSTRVAASGASPLPANTWTHLAVTYDGSALRLYVNGAQAGTVAQSGSLATSTGALQIGGDSALGQYFQGIIDEVRIYNVALTPTQIQADMTGPLGGSFPIATLSATNLDFGSRSVGSTSPAQTVTLTNTGSAQLTIASITVGGTNSSDFAQTNNCGSGLAAGAACTISVTFKPGATGSRSGVVSINDNAAGSPHLITLAGSGGNLTIAPRTAVLTPNQAQQFSAAGGTGARWSVDGVQGGNTSSGTITTAGLYSPPAASGTHVVTVTTSDGQQSSSATVYVTTNAGVFTHHNDNARTGQNLGETVLTTANVAPATFGKLASYTLDGNSHASPLYVAGVNIPGQGVRNVVYAATEHNSVYAFDADGLSASPYWKASFINPASGITTVPSQDTGECCDISPEIGITGTPVIDRSSSTLYVVAKTKEVSGGTTNYRQRLHALDLATGAEKFGGPVLIQASVPGTGGSSQGGNVSFNALRENQRPALLLSNGVVYIGFGAHGDIQPYHGWLLGYNATTLQQVFVHNTSPNDNGAGLWQANGGPAADASGNIYFVTGNGLFDVNTGGKDYGDSYVKINTAGTVLDYFTPHDQANISGNNFDLGAAGPLLLPDQPGTHPHLLVSAGKNNTVYLLDRDAMGHYNASNDSQIVQSLVNAFPFGRPEPGNFSAPVYFNGRVYFGPVADTIQAFTLTNGRLSTSPTSASSVTYSYPGAALAISANGSANGILWAIQRNGDCGVEITCGSAAPGVLRAYDASNLGVELYSSDRMGSRDALDFAAKFSVPLVVNGKVFVTTLGRLTVFGLLP